MSLTFKEFVDKKTREDKKQLNVVKKILEKNGMTVNSFTESEDPYIFLTSPDKSLSFEGIRIYKIAGSVAFRVQKESKTHPYGKAYPLDIEEMYDDLMSDQRYTEEKAGREIIEAIIAELKKFFGKSAEAERDLRGDQFEKDTDPLGSVIISTQGTDYSSKVTSKSYSRIP